MNGFFISRRKTMELVGLLLLNILFYVLWNSWDFNILFSLGYIWNWVASQEADITLGNSRRYRFSTLKTVFNLKNLFLKPFATMPEAVKLVLRTLPAGIFWSAVILFNESVLPWWAVFAGSLTIELVQIEPKLFKAKEPQP